MLDLTKLPVRASRLLFVPILGEQTMQSWQRTFLGICAIPRDLSDFELQAFFTFSADERRFFETRRTDAHKLGRALHVGFIRLSGQLLDAKRIVPASLWRHLGHLARRPESRVRLAQIDVPTRPHAARANA